MTRLVTKGYKYRLYPTATQQEQLKVNFNCCRFVYNYFLAKSIEDYNNGQPYNSAYSNQKLLTQLKKNDQYSWLKLADSQALNSSISHLDRAYSNFFKRAKSRSQAPGFPKFKKKSHKQSYTASKTGPAVLKIYDEIGKIQIPKVGKVKIRYHRPITGRITSAAITLTTSGKYFISLTCVDCPVAIDESIQSAPVIGLDVGIKSFLVDSDGNEIANPKFLRKSENSIKKASRKLSRKQRGSNNYNKQRIVLAKKHEKISNQRKDFLHKLSTYYAKNHSVICIEDLQVSNMVKNHVLAKSISDASWSMFATMLQYKADWSGATLVKVDRFFPSSQLCSCCGYKNSAIKDLSIREWACPHCNSEQDRDVNAAKNILKEGIRILTN